MDNGVDNSDVVEKPLSIKDELVQEAIGWAKTVLFAVAIAILITQFVIVNASVESPSMEGTIMTNDRIIAFRLSYLFSSPNTFDIIVFAGTGDDTAEYVKRVIGIPGDTINIINGQVFVNGSTSPLRDDFVNGPIMGNYGPFVVPERHFFVLGDYRTNSTDSRHWLGNSFVYQGDIIGRVVLRYMPRFSMLLNT